MNISLNAESAWKYRQKLLEYRNPLWLNQYSTYLGFNFIIYSQILIKAMWSHLSEALQEVNLPQHLSSLLQLFTHFFWGGDMD